MYDVAIIGAGVIGSAIARELSRYQANVCVIEREEDVCDGTSKSQQCHHPRRLRRGPGFLKGKVKCPRQRDDGCLSKTSTFRLRETVPSSYVPKIGTAAVLMPF